MNNNRLYTENLLEAFKNRTQRKFGLEVGRFSTGLFIALNALKKSWVKKTCKIAVPSFLCYSPLAAIHSAGWKPVFCDIDKNDGNSSTKNYLEVLKKNEVQALLFVHILGNINPPTDILNYCKKNNIVFIEDAAQAYGGYYNKEPVGSFGDISIISFGKTKLISSPNSGGIVFTNSPDYFNAIKNEKEALCFSDLLVNSNAFITSYYNAKNQLVSGKSPQILFSNLIQKYTPFIIKKWEDTNSKILLEKFEGIDSQIEQRLEKMNLYSSYLNNSPLLSMVNGNSVPWRASFRIEGLCRNVQEKISNELRLLNIDVSNWYLPAHWLFKKDTQNNKLTNTEKISSEIFQFWIDDSISISMIKRNVGIIKKVTSKYVN